MNIGKYFELFFNEQFVNLTIYMSVNVSQTVMLGTGHANNQLAFA